MSPQSWRVVPVQKKGSGTDSPAIEMRSMLKRTFLFSNRGNRVLRPRNPSNFK